MGGVGRAGRACGVETSRIGAWAGGACAAGMVSAAEAAGETRDARTGGLIG